MRVGLARAHLRRAIGLFDLAHVLGHERFGKARPASPRIELILRAEKRFARHDIHINSRLMIVPVGVMERWFRSAVVRYLILQRGQPCLQFRLRRSLITVWHGILRQRNASQCQRNHRPGHHPNHLHILYRKNAEIAFYSRGAIQTAPKLSTFLRNAPSEECSFDEFRSEKLFVRRRSAGPPLSAAQRTRRRRRGKSTWMEVAWEDRPPRFCLTREKRTPSA